MDDAHLIAAHLSGDPGALSVLMDRHGAPLMGFLASRVGGEAEDLFQETWSRAEKALPRYRHQDAFRAWLFQIARRQIIDHHRRRQSRIRLQSQAHPPDTATTDTPESHCTARQLSLATEQALAALAPPVAEVVRLRLIAGVPFREIARRQGVPLNTALGRMHRGLKQIRQHLVAGGLLTKGAP